MTNKYPDHIMETLRQRLHGLHETDISKDDEINNLPGHEAFAEVIGWEIGDEAWASVILGWLKDCGYEVTPPSEEGG